jgi:hypothetical protein
MTNNYHFEQHASSNINQSGLSTEVVTDTKVEHNDVNNYGQIAQSAAITGAIAVAFVVGSQYLQNTFGKPTMQTSQGEAVGKPNNTFDTDKWHFSLISSDALDPNKPLNASSLHNYNKPDVVTTITTNEVNASINTNELTINKK